MSDKKWTTFNELLKSNRKLEEEVKNLQGKLSNVEDDLRHAKDDLKRAKDDVEEYMVCYSCGIDQWYK